MKLYLDTANLNEIKRFNKLGLVKGVTTNPSLIAKMGVDTKEQIKKISNEVEGPVSAEVSALSVNASDMIEEALELSRINSNVVIKIPMTLEGMKAVKYLSDKGIKTNVTLIFNTNQAILASNAGATYVSPFIGRLNDIGVDGLGLIEEISSLFDKHDIKTEIIAASIRSVDQVRKAFDKGAHIATIPSEILEKMSKHPLTDSGINQFKEDHLKVFGDNNE